MITTTGGGMLVARDPELVERARFWSMQARDPAIAYEHSEIGYNYRLSNVLAGIGRGQLRSVRANGSHSAVPSPFATETPSPICPASTLCRRRLTVCTRIGSVVS